MEDSTLNFNSFNVDVNVNSNFMAPTLDEWSTNEISGDLEAWAQESSQQSRDRNVPESESDGDGSDDESIIDTFCEEEDSELSFYENQSNVFQDISEAEEYLDADTHSVPAGESSPFEDQLASALWSHLDSNNNNNNNNIGFQGMC